MPSVLLLKGNYMTISFYTENYNGDITRHIIECDETSFAYSEPNLGETNHLFLEKIDKYYDCENINREEADHFIEQLMDSGKVSIPQKYLFHECQKDLADIHNI